MEEEKSLTKLENVQLMEEFNTTEEDNKAIVITHSFSESESISKRIKCENYQQNEHSPKMKLGQQHSEDADSSSEECFSIPVGKTLTDDDQLEPLVYISESDEQVVTTPPPPGDETNDLECTLCSKTFISKKSLKRHFQVHNPSKPYTCDICNKRYKRLHDINHHRKLHRSKMKLSCEICDFTTFYHSAITNHRNRHAQNYKYNCDLCGKGFFVRTWFMEHINYHTGEKPYKCDLCGKCFMYSRYLTAHKKDMHSTLNGMRPINRCPFCEQLFSHKKSLQHHMKSHTGENKCLCDICGKELSSRDHLKLHRRIHTGEKPNMCSICGKAFAKRCNLISHERIHTGERPYCCDLCDKRFNQHSALVIHRRLHTGHRPYKCSICQKTFVCQSTLTTHMKGAGREPVRWRHGDVCWPAVVAAGVPTAAAAVGVLSQWPHGSTTAVPSSDVGDPASRNCNCTPKPSRPMSSILLFVR